MEAPNPKYLPKNNCFKGKICVNGFNVRAQQFPTAINEKVGEVIRVDTYPKQTLTQNACF